MQHLCPRCRQAVTTADEGSLSFCVHCGAPQIRLAPGVEFDPAEPPPVPEAAALSGIDGADGIVWSGAIRCAALAGAIALVLAVLGAWKDVLSPLELFWAMAAPIVTLGIYSARFPRSRIRPRFGARVGLLTGAAIVVASLAVVFVDGLLNRFVFHTSSALDSNTAQAFAQAQQRGALWAGSQPPDVAAQMTHLLALPEFRAGMLMLMIALPAAVYLLFAMAGGAFAGMLRARTPGDR